MGLQNPGPAWLFCPADRPERYQKAAAAADIVILDLEDGCAAADRPAARKALVDVPLDPTRTVVRVNPFGTADQKLDLEALKKTPYDTVMLPKCEAAEQVSALAPLHVIVLVESPMGALAVTKTVRVDNAFAVMWGAEDLFAALGGTANRYPDGTYREVARHVRSQSCWLPRRTVASLWIRSTSTSKISTGCAPKSTTRSRWASTRRLLSTPPSYP